VLAILTAISLLTHMLVGCCWHHEHPCAEHAAETVSATVVGEHEHDEPEPAHHEHDDGHCQGQRCITLLRDAIHVPSPDDVVSPSLVCDGGCELHLMHWSGRADLGEPAISFPLRTHLLLQVLLI
jgi:hypothetical protein